MHHADIVTGPDGNLYVTSLSNGAVYMISSKNLGSNRAATASRPPKVATGPSDPATAASPSPSTAVQGLHFVPGPQINGSILNAAAAITNNDTWAVGDIATGSGATQTLAAHFNGTSWGVVPTPSVAGGVTFDASGVSNGVIRSNASTGAGASARTAAPTTAAPTKAMWASLDAAALDQLFAAAGKGDQPWALGGHRSRTHEPGALGGLDVLPEDIWSWDRA
jgi:hypothetical protein